MTLLLILKSVIISSCGEKARKIQFWEVSFLHCFQITWCLRIHKNRVLIRSVSKVAWVAKGRNRQSHMAPPKWARDPPSLSRHCLPGLPLIGLPKLLFFFVSWCISFPPILLLLSFLQSFLSFSIIETQASCFET